MPTPPPQVSQFDQHQIAALQALQSLLASFGGLITATREAALNKSLGVDLSREERRQRCDACYEPSLALKPHARRLAADGGKAQPLAAELLQARAPSR